MQPRFALRDVLQGRSVQLSDGTSGMAHGVGEDGALLVHTAAGMLPITSSEISVRPAPAGGPSA
jgi:BirA family biotin operon repressor/biotin-[acetyl-CoA-carboxylase] ligase